LAQEEAKRQKGNAPADGGQDGPGAQAVEHVR
jgi:hypothetical protein